MAAAGRSPRRDRARRAYPVYARRMRAARRDDRSHRAHCTLRIPYAIAPCTSTTTIRPSLHPRIHTIPRPALAPVRVHVASTWPPPSHGRGRAARSQRDPTARRRRCRCCCCGSRRPRRRRRRADRSSPPPECTFRKVKYPRPGPISADISRRICLGEYIAANISAPDARASRPSSRRLRQ